MPKICKKAFIKLTGFREKRALSLEQFSLFSKSDNHSSKYSSDESAINISAKKLKLSLK